MRLFIFFFLSFGCTSTTLMVKPNIQPTRTLIEERLQQSETQFDVKCWTSTKNISNLMFGFQTSDRAFHVRERLITEFSFMLWKYAQDLNRDKSLIAISEIKQVLEVYSRLRIKKIQAGVEIQLPAGEDNKLAPPIFISDLDLFDYRRTSNSWKTLFQVASFEAPEWGLSANLTIDALDHMAWLIDLYAITLTLKTIDNAKAEGSPVVEERHVKRQYLGLFLGPKIDGWSPGGRYAERAFSQALNYAFFKRISLQRVNQKLDETKVMQTLAKIAGKPLTERGYRAYQETLKAFTLTLWEKAQQLTQSDQYMIKGEDVYDLIMSVMPYRIDDLSNVIFFPDSIKPRLFQEFEGDTIRDDGYHWAIISEILEEKGRKFEAQSPRDHLLPLDMMAAEELTELISSYAVPLLKDAAELATDFVDSGNILASHASLLNYTKRFPERKRSSRPITALNLPKWDRPLFIDETKKLEVIDFLRPEYLSDTNMQAATLMSFDAFRGISTGDLNGDGYPDLFVAHEKGDNFLYLNRGGTHFEDVYKTLKLPQLPSSTAGHFIDYNNDGCVDLFIQRTYLPSKIFRNDCNQSLTDVTDLVLPAINDLPVTGSLWFDANNDGLLDLYLITTGDFKNGFLPMMGDFTNASENKLFLQNKNHTFKDFTKQSRTGDKRITLAVAAFDADNDGDSDLYLVNDGSRNILLRNDGRGVFTDVSTASNTDDFGNGMGVSVADINGDERLDLYVTNISLWNPRNRYIRPDRATQVKSDKDVDRNLRARQANRLYLNRGRLRFEDRHKELIPRYSKTSWGWDNFFVDVDNNGYQDIFVINGFRPESFGHSSEENFLLYYTEETKLFEVVPGASSGVGLKSNSRAGVQFDLDLDGAVDLAVAGLHSPRIYRNTSAAGVNQWLRVKLVGTKNNRDGIGAVVTVKTPGLSQTLQQGTIGGGFIGYHNLPLHFGLAKSSRVLEVKVRWPGGKTQTLRDVSPNQLLTVTENP